MFSLLKYSVWFTAGHCFRLQIYFPRSSVTRRGTQSLNCPHMILSVPFTVGHFSSFVQAGVGCSPWLFPAHSVKLSHSHLCRLKTYLQKTPCVTVSYSLAHALICRHKDIASASLLKMLLFIFLCFQYRCTVSVLFDPTIITARSLWRHIRS